MRVRHETYTPTEAALARFKASAVVNPVTNNEPLMPLAIIFPGDEGHNTPFKKTVFKQETLGRVRQRVARNRVNPSNQTNELSRIAEMETDLANTAISQLTQPSGLEEVNRSPFELLKQVAPEGTTLESLQEIWTHGELVKYVIECVIKTTKKVWETENPASLSEKERQIAANLNLLIKQGYNQQRIAHVLRLLFSIPTKSTASAPTPAAMQAS